MQKTSPMSVRQLAAFLGVQLTSAYHLIWSGKIAAEQVAGWPVRWHVDAASAKAYKAARAEREAVQLERSQARTARAAARAERDADFQAKREALNA